MRTTDRRVRRRRILIGVAVTAALTAGAALLSATRPSSHDTPPTVGRADRADAPTTVSTPTDGDGSGAFAQDRDGAASAAVAYAGASQRWLYLPDAEIREAVAGVATPDGAEELAEEVVADVTTARERLGVSPGRVWWLVRPLAWNVERYSPAKAQVSVWTVTVLSAVEVATPQAEWMTVSIDLAWVEGGWRVEDIRSTPGPTPMTGPNDQPWDAEPFDQALDGFTRLGEMPAR
jgi:hypothetical protein